MCGIILRRTWLGRLVVLVFLFIVYVLDVVDCVRGGGFLGKFGSGSKGVSICECCDMDISCGFR